VLEYLNFAKNRLPAGVEPKLGRTPPVLMGLSVRALSGYYCADHPQGIWRDESAKRWYADPTDAPEDRRPHLIKVRAFEEPGNCPLAARRFSLPIRTWEVSAASKTGICATSSRPFRCRGSGLHRRFVKQYQVVLKPEKLLAYKLPIKDIMMAVQRSNNDVGGSVVEMSENEYMIRSRGYLQGIKDLSNVGRSGKRRHTDYVVRWWHASSCRRRGAAASASGTAKAKRSAARHWPLRRQRLSSHP